MSAPTEPQASGFPAADGPPRPRIHGRTLERRLLRNAALNDCWEDAEIVPLAARPVLSQVAELVAQSADGAEYRPDPAVYGHRSLAQWVARRLRAVGAEAEVERHLATLHRVKLIVLTEGGVRLGITSVRGPDRRPASGGVSAKRQAANWANAQMSPGPRKPGETDEEFAARRALKRQKVKPEGQGFFIMASKGGKGTDAEAALADDLEADGVAQSQSEAKTDPTVGSNQTQSEAKTDPTVGSNQTQSEAKTDPTVGSVASRAPGLSAAAAEESDKNLQAATAALTPRAKSHRESQTDPTVGSNQTHGGFDLGSDLGSAVASAEATAASAMASIEAKPARPAEPAKSAKSRGDLREPSVSRAAGAPKLDAAAVGATAWALGEEMAAQFKFTPEHRAEAPSIMQAHLDVGYSPDQVRAVLALKAGSVLSSARVLRKILGGKFPGVAYAASAPAESQKEGPAKISYHQDCARLPGFARASMEFRSAASRLLFGLEAENPAALARSVSFTSEKYPDAFRLVATIRPELWELAGRDPPASPAATGDRRMG